jgi:hypothetical protein
MDLMDMITLVDRHYDQSGEELVLRAFKGEEDPMELGDTLAVFLAKEVESVWDPKGTPEDNFQTVETAIKRAEEVLRRVRYELARL